MLQYAQISEPEAMNTEQLTDLARNALDDLKGIDVTTLDVSEKTSVTDAMIICTGSSARHVKSLANEVLVKSKEAGVTPLGSEGESQGDWVLIDLGDVVVHVMTAQTRDFYALEKLWSVDSEASPDAVVDIEGQLGRLRKP